MFKPRTRVWLALLVALLAAFALRVFRLSIQSLWYDEAFSVWLARLDLGAITARTAADIQPPLYYYLLHFWMLLAGDSEFAVRFLSLAFGVLMTPLLYVTARRLFHSTAASLLAALLALVSPLYVWYSQEARMYTLITWLGLLSSYALLRATDPTPAARNQGRWWAVFAAANIAGLYTHYFALALVAFQLLYAVWQLAVRRPSFAAHPSPSSSILRPFVAFAAIPVAFIPWLPPMLNRLGEDASYWRGALKLDEAVRHIFINFTMGESVLEDQARVLAAVWLVAVLVGLAAWLVTTRRKPVLAPALGLAILYLVVPLALLLFLFYRNPKFNARYLMIASPGLMLLTSAGLAGLWAGVRSRNPVGRVGAAALFAAAAVGVFIPALWSDENAYFDPAFTKADFRGVAGYVAAHAAPDEAIILSSGHLFPAFDYYYRDAQLPELRLPDDATLNIEHVLGFSAADELNRALGGARGVWLVQWQDEVADPNGMLPLLLSSRGAEQRVDSTFWHVKLRHWALPLGARFSDQPELTVKREANFKNKIELLGLAAPAPTPADQGASFNLYWQALEPLSEDYQVALRVVDAQGNVWGKLDRRPAGYTYPTTRWKKGEKLFGSYTIPLLPGAPAGDYYVTATLFTASDPSGLDVLAATGAPIGKTVKLGPFPVLPAEKQPDVLVLQIQHTLNRRVGPFTLLGYNLPRADASAGESIPLTLFWRAERAPAADYRFQLELAGRPSQSFPLANDSYGASRWRAGEIMRGQFLVTIPADAAPGAAGLQLRLVGPETQTVDLMQSLTVQKTDRVFLPPPMQYKQEANFANAIGLAGYALSAAQLRAGDTLTVTLNWQALGKPDRPYTVFVHLLDKDSKVPVQRDAQPLNGRRPTPTWVQGEYLADEYALVLKPTLPPNEYPAELPAGEYRLEIGWYDASDPSYARLPVLGADGSGVGDRVILDQTITLTGRE